MYTYIYVMYYIYIYDAHSTHNLYTDTILGTFTSARAPGRGTAAVGSIL